MCVKQIVRIVSLNTLNNEGRPQVFFKGGDIVELEKTYKPPNYILKRIPCGQCVQCRIQKAQEWAFRCMMEAKEYQNNIMINLTYDDENIPKSLKIEPRTGETSESYTLKEKDVTDFLKRLRMYWERNYNFKKSENNPGIRYYYCGEYGSNKEYIDWKGIKREGTERPHYHLLMFNLKVEDLKFWKWVKCEFSKEKNPMFTSKTLSKLWGKGTVTVNEVNYETCCYVARYVMKKFKGPTSTEHYEIKGQVPEFVRMSRRPGIGQAFFMKNKQKIENEEVFWQRTKKGLKEVKMPRYFDKLIEAENPKLIQELKNKRLKRAKEYWENLSEKTDLNQNEYIDNQEVKLKNKYKKLIRVLK